ncbi:MAG: peptidase S16 [Methylocystis sp.]|nr:MAG: peptidase S16 [Methylocystis sp.]
MSLNRPYADIDELPRVLPLFPLSGAILLPRGELPLNVFEPRYLAMVDDAIAGARLIGMIQPLPGDETVGEAMQLYDVGCAGRITRLAETGDGRYLVTLTGVARFRVLEELKVRTQYRQCQVAYDEFFEDLTMGAGADAVDRESMVSMLRNFAECSKLEVDWASIDAAPTETLVNALAMMCPFGANDKQALIEAIDLKTRAETLIALAKLDLAQRNGDRPQWH